MKIITYATHSEGLFETIKKDSDLVVLGFGTKWKGFVNRDKIILDYLNTLPEDEIIVLIDGFDTVIKNKINLKQTFESLDCKVLYSQEDKSGFSEYLPSFLEKYLKHKVFGICKDGLTANCGLSMGYVKYFKIILITIINGSSDDDQRNLNQSCSHLPFIKIDSDKLIFENCSSMVNVVNSKAFFCQIPGEMSRNRIKRAMVEYPKYFIPEIIILLLIIIILIYGTWKKTSRKFRMSGR